jgi:hypothetical protein
MDRSFLSHTEVIEASRKFVCVRLTSYENEAETAFCRSLMVGRSGDVENTTFAILAPDGKTSLIRASRGTRGLFTDAADMAEKMIAISGKYAGKTEATPPLPIALDTHIGLDIAACDNRPFLVVIAADAATRNNLEARVSELAWSSEFIGTYIYATAASAAEIKGVKDIPGGDGVAIIEPDAFGQSGRLMHFVAMKESKEKLVATMKSSLKEANATAKSRQSHRAAGVQLGAFWETKFPVTDPQEAQARERARQEIERKRTKP